MSGDQSLKMEKRCAAVLAIANALMVHRTLDAVMIHEIIASAPEQARRADWIVQGTR
jgi:hypothetical protein